jgi:hypothetical protein
VRAPIRPSIPSSINSHLCSLAPIAKMDCFVVMVDLSREAHTSQQLEYAVMAMKEVFQRPEFDDLAVFLFGYDINLSYYDLGGSEPQRIVVGLDGENPFQCFPYSLAQARVSGYHNEGAAIRGT